MKRILVPTDFSKHAGYALHVAAQLAKRLDAELYLAHMLELPLPQVDALSAHKDLPEVLFFMKAAHKRFKAIAQQDELKGIKVHEIIKPSKAFNGIMAECSAHDVDLIVMGSHGSSGFQEMFIGSNTEKVVRKSPVPVLVIKHHHPVFRVYNFVYASDFTEDKKSSFFRAIQFADLLDATLHLLYVNTPTKFLTTDAAESKMESFVKGLHFKNFTLNIYNDETVEQGILNFARHIDAGLIGMSTHGRKGLAHFLNGSISEDLVNHAKRPVITFKL